MSIKDCPHVDKDAHLAVCDKYKTNGYLDGDKPLFFADIIEAYEVAKAAAMKRESGKAASQMSNEEYQKADEWMWANTPLKTDIPFKLSKAAEDVYMERKRQVLVEGWTPAHDDLHVVSDLATAGACYALAGLEHYIDEQEVAKAIWPWDKSWWKPKDNRRNLVRGAALIIAEIERLDRREALTKTTSIEGQS